MLVVPNFGQLFVIECDALGTIIGIVLSQDGKPIRFFIEKLPESKQEYFTYDLEFYALP